MGKEAEGGKDTVQSRGEGTLSLREVQPVMVTAARLVVRKPWKLPTLPTNKGSITQTITASPFQRVSALSFKNEDSTEVPQKIKN